MTTVLLMTGFEAFGHAPKAPADSCHVKGTVKPDRQGQSESSDLRRQRFGGDRYYRRECRFRLRHKCGHCLLAHK